MRSLDVSIIFQREISNISNLINNNRFEFLNSDIRNLKDCQLACSQIDIVLHQAALGSVTRSIIDPIESNNVNISGFLNMLVASRDNNVKRFIFAQVVQLTVILLNCLRWKLLLEHLYHHTR